MRIYNLLKALREIQFQVFAVEFLHTVVLVFGIGLPAALVQTGDELRRDVLVVGVRLDDSLQKGNRSFWLPLAGLL